MRRMIADDERPMIEAASVYLMMLSGWSVIEGAPTAGDNEQDYIRFLQTIVSHS